MSKRSLAARILTMLQVPTILNAYWGANRLTVLAYHRIIDSNQPDFDYYEANVSATPAMFAQQMAYIDQHFNVVSLAEVIAFLNGESHLPPRALLITFDDGYLDNYVNARPILKQYQFPAVIFLMTSRMENTTLRPWWDTCAYAFHHTSKNDVTLPLIGDVVWTSSAERRSYREQFITALKNVPEKDKQRYLIALHKALEVQKAQDAKPLFVNWDQVRELVADGIACQPHTVTHPILTRISDEQVKQELQGSRDKIVAETDQTIQAFAYPNGSTKDYHSVAINTLKELDYVAAFTLTAGPVPYLEAKQHPYEIKRVYLGRRDSMDIFKLKVMGLDALVNRGSYIQPSK